jgi:hypothetical protein
VLGHRDPWWAAGGGPPASASLGNAGAGAAVPPHAPRHDDALGDERGQPAADLESRRPARAIETAGATLAHHPLWTIKDAVQPNQTPPHPHT